MKKLYFILTVLMHLNLFSQDYKGVWFYDSHKANTNSANPKNNQDGTDGTDQVEFNPNTYLHPSLKGVLLFFGWDQLQPSAGIYKWSYLDSAITTAITTTASNKPNFKIGISIWTGKYAPDWLYSSAGGIDSFRTSGKDSGVYPNYLNKKHDTTTYTRSVNDTATTPYERLWRKMIDSLISHLNANYSGLYSNHILFMSAAEGSTGDLAPYKGTPIDSAYKISNLNGNDEWQLFVKRCWAYTASKMRTAANLKDSLHLLLNTGAPSDVFDSANFNNPNLKKFDSAANSSIFKWVSNATSSVDSVNIFLKKSWRKADGQGHWYQLNYEPYFKKAFTDSKAANPGVLTRDEFDLSGFDAGNLDTTCVNTSNIYATAANALNADLDIWCILSPQLYDINTGAELTKNTEVFNMFNTLKQIEALSTAPSATGAYCFLKDGLDANDFSRFSSVSFGTGCSQSTATPAFYTGSPNCGRTWCRNIAAYKYKTANQKLLLGAQQLDSDYAQGVPSHQYLGVRDYNDVGWYTFNSKTTVDTSGNVLSTTSYGNSEKFMHQQNANLRSVGSYGNATRNANIGAYGRFGRYIVSTTDTLSFDVNDNMGSTVCGTGTTKVYKINVVYMDDSSGSKWQLYFNNATDNNKTFDTFMVVNNGSHSGKGWKIVTFSAGTCIAFANGGSMMKPDFYIRNLDTIADKFALIYITTTCLTNAGCSINNPAFGKATWSTSLFPSSFTANKQDIIYSTYATSGKLKTSLVTVFPNPALDYTTVTFNNAHTKCTLILSSMHGKQLYQKTIQQINKGASERISLKDFAKGIYFLKIACDDATVQTEKIIVE